MKFDEKSKSKGHLVFSKNLLLQINCLYFFGANMDKSVLQGGLPEVTLSSTTFLHPDWGHHDHHMQDLVILRLLGVTDRLINPSMHLVRVAPDCNRSYCEDSFSGYSGSV